LAASDLAWARMAAREGLHCTIARLSEVLRRLGENGGNGFSLGEHALVLSDLDNISSLFSLFLAFSFAPLKFFPFSTLLYLKFTQNKDQVTSFQQKLGSSFFFRFRENQS